MLRRPRWGWCRCPTGAAPGDPSTAQKKRREREEKGSEDSMSQFLSPDSHHHLLLSGPCTPQGPYSWSCSHGSCAREGGDESSRSSPPSHQVRMLRLRFISTFPAGVCRRGGTGASASSVHFCSRLHLLPPLAQTPDSQAVHGGWKRGTYSAPEVAAGNAVLHGQAILTVGDGRPVGHGEDAWGRGEGRQKLHSMTTSARMPSAQSEPHAAVALSHHGH